MSIDPNLVCTNNSSRQSCEDFLLSVSCATQLPSYTDHCSSVVPQYATKINTNPSFPLGHFHTGYGGGTGIFSHVSSSFSKSFVFRTRNAYHTDIEGVLKVEADFLFPMPYIYNYGRNFNNGQAQDSRMGKDLVRLSLEGYWSESSGKLCMVGYSRLKIDDFLDLKAVLKLESVKKSSTVTSLISGTLECLNSNDDSYCFESISILMLPHMNYEYTLVSKQFQGGDEGDSDKKVPFTSFPGPSFCNEGWWPPNGFYLNYASNCDSANRCSPFDEDLPPVVFISGFGCLEKEGRLRVLVEFSERRSNGFYQPFYPNRTFLGEGIWDESELYIVACRFLEVAESLASARVADCSIRLSLSFSDTLSIRQTNNMVGKVSTNRTLDDPGYFDNIIFRSSENRIVGVPGLKYEYTESDRVRNSCTRTQLLKNSKKRYPNGNYIHMRFDMSIRSSVGRIAFGYAIPFSVGDQFYEKHLDEANSAVEATLSSSPIKMSYKFRFTMLPGVKLGEGLSLFTTASKFDEVEVSAEGIYDKKSGALCLAGCRDLGLDNQTENFDCEIILKFQLPPLEEENNEGNIKGRIQSSREKSDPLYFESLETSSAEYSTGEEKKFIRRMDMEIAISLISSALSCFFVGLQRLHSKRHPEILPLMSLVMLSILTLGHLVPLVTSFGSLLLNNDDQQHHFHGTGRFLEANEMLRNLLKLVAFLFQFHLLQLTWIARINSERYKSLSVVEKTTFLLSVPIYAVGALLALLMNWSIEKGIELQTYGGLILDGFLLPQILMNIFRDSKENVLSSSFYIGMTFLQLLPHVHTLYEAYTSLLQIPPWEVITVLVDLVLAAVIYLQQHHVVSATANNISAQISAIPILNGTNFKVWKENVEIVLNCMDLDLALRTEQPTLAKDTSNETKVEK
eukprot:XP_002531712.2 uncharacterized protein LOC8273567 [Ricinus communis]